jgi:hypothetical protein
MSEERNSAYDLGRETACEYPDALEPVLGINPFDWGAADSRAFKRCEAAAYWQKLETARKCGRPAKGTINGQPVCGIHLRAKDLCMPEEYRS